LIQLPSINVPSDAPQWARNVVALIGNSFAGITGALQRVSTSEWVDVTSPTIASQPFLVPHNLGRTPKGATCLAEQNGNLVATADDKREWSKTYIKVRFNVASTKLLIRID
jgi:hypothetical protein